MYLYLSEIATIINVADLKRAMWLLIGGMIIALVFIYFNKTVNGALVRSLMENDAYSPETAKTLAELGFEKKESVLKKLTRSESLRRIVGAVDEQVDENARFYIREDEKKRASEQYGTSGNELILTIVGAVALVIVGLLIEIIF